jgi:hypothetical protein
MEEVSVAEYYALILLSLTENFGCVVLETLVQGTPLIFSKSTPLGALEKLGVGYWVDSSEDAISNSIIRFTDLTELEYLKRRDNTYNLCASKCNIASNGVVWERLFKKLINDKY